MLFIIKRCSRLVFVGFCLFVSVFTLAQEQQFDAKHIKAAYLVNFIKHIDWPDEKSKKSYQLAIYKDQEFYQFLSTILKQKKIKGKNLVVRYADSAAQLKQADSIYIAKQFNKSIPQLANAVRGSKTLVITDSSDNKHDVMINLIQDEQSGVISFEVNKSNIIYEQLVISADLLLLGGTELDIATLYRETEMAMQKTRQQSSALKENLEKQQQMLKQSLQQLKLSKAALLKLNEELQASVIAANKQKDELAQLKVSVTQKQTLLGQQKQALQLISNQSKQTEEELATQQELLAQKSSKNVQILATVNQNKQVLAKQQQELAEHREQLKQQTSELTDKQQTITDQQGYILVTTVLITITLIVAFLLVFFFIKNKKMTNKLSATVANLNDTQEQLVQSEKMASLGRLVAGVAHEINTPLSIAITANSLVLDDTNEIVEKIASASLSKGRMNKYIEKSMQSLSMSEKALERVKDLLTNFKLVAADQIIVDQREINLAKYIEEVMTTLSVEMKNGNISYQFSGESAVQINTLPGVFAQVLTNLVMNSIIHGFDGKDSGEITINLSLNEQQNAVITYADNGHGMDDDVLENIFEPFFTTKRGEGSTGLGMNIVYNIVNQQLKGEIVVESEQGLGSTMVITLPQTI